MTRYFTSCNELSMYSFSKILETNNFAWLVVGYDGYDEVEFDEQKAIDVWQYLYEEYLKLTENNKSLLYFTVIQELTYLKTRYEVVSTLLQQLNNGIEDKEMRLSYFKELVHWKYRINSEKPLKDELERMYKQLRQSTNKIKIKEQELSDLKIDEGEKLSIIEQTVKLELALEKNDIDLKKTVVSKYVAMIKEVELRNKARKKNNK